MGLLTQTSPWTDKICCGLWGGNERRAMLLFSIFAPLSWTLRMFLFFSLLVPPQLLAAARKSTASSPITAQPALCACSPRWAHQIYSFLIFWLGSHHRTGLGVNPSASIFFFFFRLFCPYYFGAVAWIPIPRTLTTGWYSWDSCFLSPSSLSIAGRPPWPRQFPLIPLASIL